MNYSKIRIPNQKVVASNPHFVTDDLILVDLTTDAN